MKKYLCLLLMAVGLTAEVRAQDNRISLNGCQGVQFEAADLLPAE